MASRSLYMRRQGDFCKNRSSPVRGSIQLAVKSQNLLARSAEMLRQAFSQINRTVPAAGAADRDGQIVLVLAFESRQPFLQQTDDVAQEIVHQRLRRQELAHRGILARERAEARIPVRVWQTARVEHEIRIGRQSTPVGKGFEQQGGAAVRGAETRRD